MKSFLKKLIFLILLILMIGSIMLASFILVTNIILRDVPFQGINTLGLLLLFLRTMILLMVYAGVLWILVTFVHEIGHIAFGLMAGFDFNFIQVLGVRLTQYQDGFKWSRNKVGGPGLASLKWSAEKNYDESNIKDFALRFSITVAGGVLFSIILPLIIFLFFGINSYTLVYGLFSLGMNIGAFLNFGIERERNDFVRIWLLNFSKEAIPLSLFHYVASAYGLNTVHISKNTSEAEKNKIDIESLKEVDLNLLDKTLEISSPLYLIQSIGFSVIANALQGNEIRATELYNDFTEMKNTMRKQYSWFEEFDEYVKSILSGNFTS